MTLLTSSGLLLEGEPVAALTRFRNAKLPGLVHLADPNGAPGSQIAGYSPSPRMGLDLLASYTVETQHGEKTLRHRRD